MPTSLQLLLQTHASRAAPPLAHLVASTTTLRDNSFNSLDERPTVRCARRGTSFRRTFGGGWAAQPPPPAAQPAGVFAFLFGLRGPPRNSPFPFGAINPSERRRSAPGCRRSCSCSCCCCCCSAGKVDPLKLRKRMSKGIAKSRPRRTAPQRQTNGSWLAVAAVFAVLVACGVAIIRTRYQARTPPEQTLPQMRGPATNLHFAAQHGDREAAKRLISSEPLTVNAATEVGSTPLHVAAEHGHLAVAQLLIANGAALDARTDAGLRPLHFAAIENDADMTRLLLESGAQPGTRTDSGHTPLHLAAQKPHLEVAKALLTHGASNEAQTNLGHTPLHLATLMGETAVVKLLLASGALVDARNGQSGHTPLHVAAHCPRAGEGCADMARLLLSLGATPSVNDSRGITPLHIAAERGADQMVTELVRRGAAVDTVTDYGLAPLSVAVYRAPIARGGAPMVGGTLSADGAPSNDLMLLRRIDPLPTLEALLDGGANVAAAHPWTGQTALHAAAYLGREAWSERMLRQSDPTAVVTDFRRHLHRGDGLEQRALSTGPTAPSSAMQRARVRSAAAAAYERAIELAPTSATAYTRLGVVRARLEEDAAYGDESAPRDHASARRAFEHAWRLQPQLASAPSHAPSEGIAAFAQRKIELALVGVGARERGTARPARTPSELSVTDVSAADATTRALGIWRSQGAVVFPSLLPPSLVAALRSTLLQTHAATVDRTTDIRKPANRALRALPVGSGVDLLNAMASALNAFLSEALQSPSMLLLELGVMSAARGASEQGWHRDDPILDSRTASVQIALVDTAAEQGALEVQPGSHTHTEATDDGHAPSVTVAVPAGSVTVYSPNVLHRGKANARREERLTVVLTLMGAGGLMPNSIPLVVQEEDAGRWWLENGELQDRRGRVGGGVV